jgi:hypothetical protein
VRRSAFQHPAASTPREARPAAGHPGVGRRTPDRGLASRNPEEHHPGGLVDEAGLAAEVEARATLNELGDGEPSRPGGRNLDVAGGVLPLDADRRGLGHALSPRNPSNLNARTGVPATGLEEDRGRGNRLEEDRGRGNRLEEDRGRGNRLEEDRGRGNRLEEDRGRETGLAAEVEAHAPLSGLGDGEPSQPEQPQRGPGCRQLVRAGRGRGNWSGQGGAAATGPGRAGPRQPVRGRPGLRQPAGGGPGPRDWAGRRSGGARDPLRSR